jgi:hypothetical protein
LIVTEAHMLAEQAEGLPIGIEAVLAEKLENR